jgi:hypothetical protein
MRSVTVAIVVLLGACTGGKPPIPDNGFRCAGNVYDKCFTEHDCSMSGMLCQTFGNLTVCTQTCNATTACPNDSTGAPGTCSAAGFCQPAAANTCHLP